MSTETELDSTVGTDSTSTEHLVQKTFSFSAGLPVLGAPLADGTYGGISMLADGTPVVVVSLGIADKRRNHADQTAWAASRGGVLATKAIFNLLLLTLGGQIPGGWYHLQDVHGASSAWCCGSNGTQYIGARSSEGSGLAVRLIPLTL